MQKQRILSKKVKNIFTVFLFAAFLFSLFMTYVISTELIHIFHKLVFKNINKDFLLKYYEIIIIFWQFLKEILVVGSLVLCWCGASYVTRKIYARLME